MSGRLTMTSADGGILSICHKLMNEIMRGPLRSLKETFMVMTTRNTTSLALMMHHAYLHMAQMMKMMWFMMRMDRSLSKFISLPVPGTSHLSILFHQISVRAITDSAKNPLSGSSMIGQVAMLVFC